MQTLWRIGELVLGGTKPPGEYTFLRDHTGDQALFWRVVPAEPWRHYTMHKLWNQSRIEAGAVKSMVSDPLYFGAETPWYCLLQMLRHRGWVHLSLHIDWTPAGGEDV